ncbi:MAG: AAA family ATPase [Rubrivivax sp.]|nr:AAA family ATPase [Rubrivivax sp.]
MRVDPTLVLLDVPHLRRGPERIDLPSNVPGHLLAYLALRADWVTREALAGLFWPDRPEPEAQHNLRVNLHRMKKLLDSWGLAERLHGELRRVRVALHCDVHLLQQAAGRGDADGVRALHRQPLLSGMALAGFPAVQEWLAVERAALDSLLERLPTAAPASTPQPAEAPARLSRPPLVGRADTLAALRGDGAPLVVVEGEPGIGKSQLLAAALPDALWLACRADRRDQPLAALVDWLEDMQDSLAERPDWPVLAAELAPLLPTLAPGLLPPPQAAAPLPRVIQAAARLLASMGRPVVVDDLQWADAALLELLRLLLQDVPVRATLRPSETTPALADWLAARAENAAVTRLRLPPLSGTDLQTLVARLSGRDAGPAHFSAWLHRRSGGNPFFALEILRALFESGRLSAAEGAEEGGWASDIDSLGTDYAELDLPQRVWGLVERRLQPLATPVRQVLAAAAVAGDARDPVLLAAVTGLAPLTVGEALATAQGAALLNERTFSHDLVREALLRSLPEPVLQVLHAGLLQHGTHLPPHRLAVHAWAAGEPEQAVAQQIRAAALDRRRGLHTLATDGLRRALDRCEAPAWRAALRVAIARAALETADLDSATAEAEAALAALPTPAVRQQALVLLAELALQQGRLAHAAKLAAEAALVDADDPDLLVLQGRLAFETGDFSADVAVLQRLLARLRRAVPGEALVQALTQLGAAHDALGDTAAGLRCHEEALAVARALGARHAEVDATLNLLWSLPDLGRHDEAIALGEHALALGAFDGTPALMNNLAFLYWDRGRFDDAEPLYTRLCETDDPSVRCFAWAKRITLAARRGDAAACQSAITQGLSTLPQTQLYRAHAVLVAAVLQHGNAAQAEEAQRWLRPDQPLDPALSTQLQAALAAQAARTGLSIPLDAGPAPGH